MKNDQDARYSVVELCWALGVSRSGLYDHEQKPDRERRREDDILAQKISLLFLEGRCTYGWRRIQKGLLREGIACGKKRILRLMRDQELEVIQKRAFRPKTTQSRHDQPIAQNRLKALPEPPQKPNEVWCADITYIPSQQEGWLYLAGESQTHDYIRHGTITLFAALSYLEGKIISRTEQSHTHLEWLRFLKQIDRETPKELDLHLIIDNYATHKHPVVQHWLKAHGRFHIHFTPTSSSWLNLVERFFGELTSEVVREASFQSLRELVRAIECYLAERNQNPKKYVWRASGLKILEKIQRAKAALAAAEVIIT